jgi:hypothetical protein
LRGETTYNVTAIQAGLAAEVRAERGGGRTTEHAYCTVTDAFGVCGLWAVGLSIHMLLLCRR